MNLTHKDIHWSLEQPFHHCYESPARLTGGTELSLLYVSGHPASVGSLYSSTRSVPRDAINCLVGGLHYGSRFISLVEELTHKSHVEMLGL